MISEIIFKKAFWILMTVGVLNWISYKLYLYWTVKWVDIPMHFLGGLWVTLVVLWFFSKKYNLKNKNILLISLLGAITVGILWEIFELVLGVTSFSDGIHYVRDTLSDLIMDTIGGVAGYYYVSSLVKKINFE